MVLTGRPPALELSFLSVWIECLPARMPSAAAVLVLVLASCGAIDVMSASADFSVSRGCPRPPRPSVAGCTGLCLTVSRAAAEPDANADSLRYAAWPKLAWQCAALQEAPSAPAVHHTQRYEPGVLTQIWSSSQTGGGGGGASSTLPRSGTLGGATAHSLMSRQPMEPPSPR